MAQVMQRCHSATMDNTRADYTATSIWDPYHLAPSTYHPPEEEAEEGEEEEEGEGPEEPQQPHLVVLCGLPAVGRFHGGHHPPPPPPPSAVGRCLSSCLPLPPYPTLLFSPTRWTDRQTHTHTHMEAGLPAVDLIG